MSNVTSYLDGWTQGTNPFTSGYLRVVADGADTLLQMDRDGNGTSYGWLSLVRLQGVAPSSLTVANFNNGYAPNDVGITATGTSTNERIDGSNSRDTLSGGAGNDTLYGNDGADSLSAGPVTITCPAGMAMTRYPAATAGTHCTARPATTASTVVAATTRCTAGPATTP
nr:hypothetical protein [Methylobacterium aquaticum]